MRAGGPAATARSPRPFDSALAPDARRIAGGVPELKPMQRPDATTRWTAVVAVRVPRDADGDLLDRARHRLRRADGVEAASDAAIQAMEPGLAATVVRIRVELVVRSCVESPALRARLADAPGVERVDELQPA